MKITVNENAIAKEMYPYIGIYQDVIVLFTSLNKGIALVHPNNDYKTEISVWRENKYAPFKGTLTIEQ